MKDVQVSPAARTASVQGGATLGDLDRATDAFGLAVPIGVVSRTGVAGLTLGRGVGWLVRKHGLACDNLLACEVVTADGEVVTASADGHPDLFWALRGGGGNFGAVASFLFRAHPVATVLGGLILHPRERAAEVLRHYRDFMTTTPEDLTAYAALITTPDGTPACAVIPCRIGEPGEGEQVLRPLRESGPPMLDAVQPMPLPTMQRMLDDAFPDGARNDWTSTFVRELSDRAIEVIVEHANRMASPLSAVVVEYHAGAAGRFGHAETAFAARAAEDDIGFMAQWTDPSEDDRHVGWARGDGRCACAVLERPLLLNLLSEDDPQTVRALFGPNYQRLAEIKRRYDPTNFFSVTQNIRPAA